MRILLLDHFITNLESNQIWIEKCLLDLASNNFVFKSTSVISCLIDRLESAMPPDLILIECGSREQIVSDLDLIQKRFYRTPVIQIVDHYSVEDIQYSLELGVIDVIKKNEDSLVVASKLLVNTIKKTTTDTAPIILLDSGKGSVGVTTIAAALGEVAVDTGLRTILIDCDFITQDLSRFLHCRPYLNEGLSLLLMSQTGLNRDSLSQTYYPVWSDNDLLYCMPPAACMDTSHTTNMLQVYIEIITRLQSDFDLLIIDIANLQFDLLNILLTKCTAYILVANNDLGSLYPTYDRYNIIKNKLKNLNQVRLVINESSPSTMSCSEARKELAGLLAPEISIFELSFDMKGCWWLASGGTLYSHSRNKVRMQLQKISSSFCKTPQLNTDSWQITNTIKEFFRKKSNKQVLKQLPAPVVTPAFVGDDLVSEPVWN